MCKSYIWEIAYFSYGETFLFVHYGAKVVVVIKNQMILPNYTVSQNQSLTQNTQVIYFLAL